MVCTNTSAALSSQEYTKPGPSMSMQILYVPVCKSDDVSTRDTKPKSSGPESTGNARVSAIPASECVPSATAKAHCARVRYNAETDGNNPTATRVIVESTTGAKANGPASCTCS